MERIEEEKEEEVAVEVEDVDGSSDISIMTLTELSVELMTSYSDLSYTVDCEDTMMADQVSLFFWLNLSFCVQHMPVCKDLAMSSTIVHPQI